MVSGHSVRIEKVDQSYQVRASASFRSGKETEWRNRDEFRLVSRDTNRRKSADWRQSRSRLSNGGRMSHSLIVLPDDTAQPIIDAIDGATKSLRVKMFIFSDPRS